jgi:hypothetical protein
MICLKSDTVPSVLYPTPTVMLPYVSISALLILVAGGSAGSCYDTANLTATFGPGLSPGAEIFLPSDPNAANETTQRYTTWAEPTFIGTIKPATEADVQYIVGLIYCYALLMLSGIR